MALKTGQEYVDSLRKLKPRIFLFGERLENAVDHPILRNSINTVKFVYDLQHDPQYEDLMTATSHLTGEKISRFDHIFQSVEDLVKKVKLQRMLGQKTGTCFMRCVMDAYNPFYSVTYDVDQKYGTSYHQRFRKFLAYIQRNNFHCAAAVTDVKGDRSLRPHQQADPDLHLHIVERRPDGLVVRGAKAHHTGIAIAHETLVMPTRDLTEKDRDYAVAFAIPIDAPGITYILGRQVSDTRKMEPGIDIDLGNAQFGVMGHEALTIFDHVFVPWERVFLCGEVEFVGTLVNNFAGYHRTSYGGCKVGLADVLIGAAATVAKYNGVFKASHVQDKLTEMVLMSETMHACGLSASTEGYRLPAGNYFINQMYANICKQYVTRYPHDIARITQDLAGGLVATMPSEKDLKNQELRPLIEKYLRGVPEVPAEHRMRIIRLIEAMSLGTSLVESMHGAGPPQAQRIMIGRQANLEHKCQLAQALAGISPPEKQ